MSSKWFTGIFGVLLVLFGVVVVNVNDVYAQDTAGTAEVTVTQVFVVQSPADGMSAATAETSACQVTAELRWYRNKRIRVLYHWHSCSDTHQVDWALASIRNPSGNFTLDSDAGSHEVYDEQWDELQPNDAIRLSTWIDGFSQPTVATRYLDRAPVWPQIHTRADEGGACFQFTGHNDPWGVFTAGDQRHIFLLAEKDWETPWLTAPNQPLVDWHVALYGDQGLTRLRAEYSFHNVPNPCYKTPPASCNGVTLSIADGTLIPTTGAEVTVTVNGTHGTQYRIVDEAGNVVAGPAAAPSLTLQALPNVTYQAQVYSESHGWTKEGCTFRYGAEQQRPSCTSVDLSIESEELISVDGTMVTATVHGENTTEYRIVANQDKVMAGPSVTNQFEFHAMPDVVYQAQVRNENSDWTSEDCQFKYIKFVNETEPPACIDVIPSVMNGSAIPSAGRAIQVSVVGHNTTQYRVLDEKQSEVVPAQAASLLSLQVKPDITYQVQVANAGNEWKTSNSCELRYTTEVISLPACEGVILSVADRSRIPLAGTLVDTKIIAKNSTRYRIIDGSNQTVMAAGNGTLTFHAIPDLLYVAEVASDTSEWLSSNACRFQYTQGAESVASCSLDPDHYGDPGGISRITAWIQGDEAKVVPITAVAVNWDNHGTVTYPTQKQAGPWVTTQPFELRSRPEVWDIGFGRYRFEAWVYVEGIQEPAYCWGVGDAPDHDNVTPDPGPFAKDNPEGKFNRGSEPSRLPTVGRLPFDGGNGPDKIELILWAFEKEGRGVNARITAIANEGKPLARLGMASVSDMVKFDGLPAREGIVYGFQIGEHGPWSPLFCSPADSNPTTITVYWGAGGMTWLSDGAAYGDCWWLTVAAALKGWVTVDETVATYNALQPIINWHGHQNLVFSLAQSRETGLGPRMQDAVIGLQAQDWQGPVIPATMPADFQQVVQDYRQPQ